MTTWSSEDFGFSSEGSSVTTKLPPKRKATPDEEELYRQRNPWERFKDAYISSALHNPIGAEGVMRYLGVARPKEVTDAQLNKLERILSERYSKKAAADPAFRGGGIYHGQAGLLNTGVDLLGSVLGGVDPTYAIAPGRVAAQRIAAQSGVNAGQDALSQAIEIHRGVRDEFDPNETLLNAAVGAVFQGSVEGVRSVRLKRAVERGSSHPDWQAVNDVIVHDLESGGSLVHPKTSPKGAMGPQQVMMATAKRPGFGINPWNGKTQEDLARVGRQYSAVMMDRYDGDTAKVLAAYNAGPGRVDRLIKKHGENWTNYLPIKTKKYVQKGLGKLSQGPDDLGEINLVRGEQPSIDEQARVNQALAPSDELASILPRDEHDFAHDPHFDEAFARGEVDDFGHPIEPDRTNVTDLTEVRRAKTDKANDGVIDENLDMADRISRGIDTGHITPEHLPHVIKARDNIQGILNDFDDALTREQKARIQDNLDILNQSIDKLGGPVDHLTPAERYEMDASAEKPVVDNTGYEKFTPNPKKRTPANDVYGQVDDIHKTLHEYTDAEWKRLPKVWQEKLVRDANEKIYYPERDPNPPAASSSAGTRRPPGINPRSSAPLKGEDHKDFRAVRSERKLVLDRLADLLDQSTPIRREAEAAISHERSRRLAAAMKAQKKSGGRQGLYEALGAMKGEMERPRIQSIADQFTPEEINGLIDHVWNSPALQGYEHIRAAKALDKLLGAQYGEIPTASEVALLAKAMPEKAAVWKRLLENEEGTLHLDMPDGAIKRGVISVAGLPRTLKASFDFSAPFRQGMFLVGRKEFWKAMPDMFRAFFSQRHFEHIQDEIVNRPNYELGNKAGLQTTHTNKGLIDREEAFVSPFAEKIPGVRHSERAYLAFLNKVRADVFDDFVRKGDDLGIDFIHDPHYLKSAARFINAATGRGTIKIMSRNAQILSNVLFSPKLMASRIQLLNPGFYVGLHPEVRKEAAKSGLIYASTVMSMLGLAGAAGADVETDPRSSDFAKIKVGNTRFDVTGGLQPYVRFYAQFLTGQQKGINDGVIRNVGWVPPVMRKYLPGEDQPAFKPTTRKDLVYSFFENKESPNANEVTRLLQGSDPVGNPLTPASEATNLFAPLIVQDTYQAYKDLGPKGLLTAIPNAGGIGVQTYTPKVKKSSNDFGFKKSDFGGTTWSSKDFK